MKLRMLAVSAGVAIAGVVGATNVARAGSAWSSEVTVTRSAGTITAWGVPILARRSADSSQFIGCIVYQWPTGSWAQCSATTAAGVTAYCTTTSPLLIAAAMAINPNTGVSFETRENSGACNSIMLTQYSNIIP
jgi:hypothetical protein